MRILSLLLLSVSLILGACQSTQNIDPVQVHQFMDEWHANAANAELDPFFNKIDSDGFYLGTQHDEIWTKAEFYAFSKPFFDRGRAWSFKPYDRNVHLSGSGDIAWFDEKLETWMGVCRGSGILELVNDELKIKHYNLSVTIANDLVQDFIEVIKRDPINEFLSKDE